MDKVKPFSIQVTGEESKVFLPNDFENIVSNNILCRLFLNLCIQNKYVLHKLNKPMGKMDELKDEQVSFIKGWYASLMGLPDYAKNLNKNFKEGCTFGIYLMLEGKKVDRNLFRKCSIEDVNIHLFGNSWKVKNEVEKSMLDQLKHFSRQVKELPKNIGTWITSQEVISVNYGLRDPLKNPILSDSEKEFLRSTFVAELEYKLEPVDTFLKEGKSSLEGILKYQEHLISIQKGLKKVKTIVSKEVDDRTNFVFRHPSNKRLVKLKKPLEDCLNNIKELPDYGNHFNSTFIYTLGKDKLVLKEPETLEDCDANKALLKSFFDQYKLSAAKCAEVQRQMDSLLRIYK